MHLSWLNCINAIKKELQQRKAWQISSNRKQRTVSTVYSVLYFFTRVKSFSFSFEVDNRCTAKYVKQIVFEFVCTLKRKRSIYFSDIDTKQNDQWSNRCSLMDAIRRSIRKLSFFLRCVWCIQPCIWLKRTQNADFIPRKTFLRCGHSKTLKL